MCIYSKWKEETICLCIGNSQFLWRGKTDMIIMPSKIKVQTSPQIISLYAINIQNKAYRIHPSTSFVTIFTMKKDIIHPIFPLVISNFLSVSYFQTHSPAWSTSLPIFPLVICIFNYFPFLPEFFSQLIVYNLLSSFSTLWIRVI